MDRSCATWVSCVWDCAQVIVDVCGKILLAWISGLGSFFFFPTGYYYADGRPCCIVSLLHISATRSNSSRASKACIFSPALGNPLLTGTAKIPHTLASRIGFTPYISPSRMITLFKHLEFKYKDNTILIFQANTHPISRKKMGEKISPYTNSYGRFQGNTWPVPLKVHFTQNQRKIVSRKYRTVYKNRD